LEHILESIRAIEQYTKEKTIDDFRRDTWLQDATMRRLEIIGEAVKNIPANFKKKYRAVPWKKAAGMRDVIIHQYFDVDLEIVWETLKKDIPELKKEIEKIVKEAE